MITRSILEDYVSEAAGYACDDTCTTSIEEAEIKVSDTETRKEWTVRHAHAGFEDATTFAESAPLPEVQSAITQMFMSRHDTNAAQFARDDLKSNGWEPLGRMSRDWAGVDKVSAINGLHRGRTLLIYRLDGDEWYFKYEEETKPG